MTSLNTSLTRADARLANGAAAILRIALGVMFLSHSLILKLYVFTLAGNAAFFQKLGLPAWMGYATFFAEAIGGVLLILGVQTRWVAAALLPILTGAVWAHSGNGWMFGYPNGGWEYPLYLVVLAVVQIMLGDGAYALSKSWVPQLQATVKPALSH
ncbi:MAG: DoxX family protein [Xanthobacteraceae bacterium]|nr:DoxX family protein [Xanthobacteraceae bacterium]